MKRGKANKMSSASRRERLAVLQPIGEVFVNGLSSGYDDQFPDSERLAALMTREDFDSAMKTINDALLDHWPCLPCKGFGYGCCVCTLGLSLYCAATQVQEAESRLQLQLRRLNGQRKFKSKGVEWELQRSWWRRSSCIEIYVNPTVAEGLQNKASGGEEAKETDKGDAVRDEAMADRVL